MKLSEQFKEFLTYCFLVLVLAFMLLGCKDSKLMTKRRQTPDEQQLEFFKEQIKIKTYYYAKNNQ